MHTTRGTGVSGDAGVSAPHRSRDFRSVGRTFLLKYGLLAAAEYLVADAHGFWRRFFLSGSWWPLMA